MWPEVTIQARNQKEVDCLLYALRRAGAASITRAGFSIEAGGLALGKILRAAQECLTEYEIDSVTVILRDGRRHVLSAPRRR
jgi:hypothetical protein